VDVVGCIAATFESAAQRRKMIGAVSETEIGMAGRPLGQARKSIYDIAVFSTEAIPFANASGLIKGVAVAL
jgi:hypothetical protein